MLDSVHHHLTIDTGEGIGLHDLTPELETRLTDSGIQEGFMTLTSRHTTTAIMINEFETRLVDDVRQFLAVLAPASAPYLHNDIHLRDCPPDEPRNAHAHLLAMLLGGSEVVAVAGGQMDLGQWQSVLLVELDGPRQRRVSLRIVGTAAKAPPTD